MSIPALPRRQLGWHLRNGRNELGLTLEQVAAMMQWSKSKLARIETAEGGGRLRELDIRELCRGLGFDDDMTTAMVELSRQSDAKCWWHTFDDVIRKSFNMYVGLEASATSLAMFRPNLIPGILQTANYARSLDRIYFPGDSDEELERRVQLRIKRQNIIMRRTHPISADIVLHESALRSVVGGRKTMAVQMRHSADVSTRPNVTIRVLPFSAGFPLGLYVGPYVILDFGRDAKGKEVTPDRVPGGLHRRHAP
ncbi:helix-turn-helix domain-containing protein [Nocardia pneumoniae]|uniref:helix-turn-helix domain-containing protein n=1 Tax=Nocardia pneumoniae TaxID=228601 RepID=UPI00278C414B|nr:helix-turn-helix transcriptional regulator [Nocardia pneumoniae]